MKRVCGMAMAGFVLVSGIGAQPPPSAAANPQSAPEMVAPARHTPLFSDLDLLRKNEFARSSQASVSVRVQDRQGRAVAGLASSDFNVVVNGTTRVARLQPRGTTAFANHQPYVLLVFPPNQETVHYIATKDAIGYFGKAAGPTLPWKVGIFDANGKFLAFTSDKAELLSNLQAVSKAVEPLQFSGYGFLGRRNGPWLDKVEAAIAAMERSDGPRIIIAMNPLAVNQFGMNEGPGAPLERVGPEELVAASERVGAHLYIDNAGGPEPLPPGGDASSSSTGRATGIGSRFGNGPFGATQRALNYSAYTTSLMMLSARETLGGFANDFKDLSAEIEHDLALAYTLEFDLTTKDQDSGVPQVEVSGTTPQLWMAMVDLMPLHTSAESGVHVASKELAARVLRAKGKPVESAEFRILQRIEYFPARAFAGAAPLLPMSATVEWTGAGARPSELAVAESVVETDLATPVLERAIETEWVARTVRWERAGQLHPGHYAWLVAVHDASGKVLASARRTFSVAYPPEGSVMLSSLVTGTTCRAETPTGGLQRRVEPGQEAIVHLTGDPLAVGGCHVVPDPADGYRSAETLHALVRIYPSRKLGKQPVEAWSAHFVMRSAAGVAESDVASGFAVDPGTGLLASAAMPLAGVQAGPHVVEVVLRGPGIKGEARESRTVVIAP